MFKKKHLKKVSHSKSTMGPIMSMEMALAEAPIKLSRIMEWVYELNFFLKPLELVWACKAVLLSFHALTV